MKLTIGLPVYNAEKYISDAIMSIINQDLKEWKCIIVDDGSSDSSLDIISRLIKNDLRFSLVVDNQNLGLPSRLNQIASLCETKYLARMDADDVMTPNRLALQLYTLQRDETIDVVGSSAYIIDNHNNVCGVRSASKTFDTLTALRHSLFIHPTVMGKARWFKDNPYDIRKKRSEDYELWSRTVAFSEFVQIDEPLLFYREVGLHHSGKYDATASEILDILINHPLNSDIIFRDYIRKLIKDIKLKRLIFRVLSSLRLEKYLLSRRSLNLDVDQQREANLVLKQVLAPLAVPADQNYGAAIGNGGN